VELENQEGLAEIARVSTLEFERIEARLAELEEGERIGRRQSGRVACEAGRLAGRSGLH